MRQCVAVMFGFLFVVGCTPAANSPRPRTLAELDKEARAARRELNAQREFNKKSFDATSAQAGKLKEVASRVGKIQDVLPKDASGELVSVSQAMDEVEARLRAQLAPVPVPQYTPPVSPAPIVQPPPAPPYVPQPPAPGGVYSYAGQQPPVTDDRYVTKFIPSFGRGSVNKLEVRDLQNERVWYAWSWCEGQEPKIHACRPRPTCRCGKDCREWVLVDPSTLPPFFPTPPGTGGQQRYTQHKVAYK